MKILCAPDSFKETLSAAAVAQAMVAGIRRADPTTIECDVCPVADGGEGTLDALTAAMGLRIEQAAVSGPRGTSVQARLGFASDGRTAVVELAEASGLVLTPPRLRDPTKTTTYGTGQLVDMAIKRGCRRIIIGLGGSATVDGGTGIAQALGASFVDGSGKLITKLMSGGLLSLVTRFKPPAFVAAGSIDIGVACDVTNPLLGPKGAAATYGPQKGATPQQVCELETGLANLARIVGGDPDQPGAGAAGGAGFGLAAMCGGRLKGGIDLVLEAVRFRNRCNGAALVLTGEGRLDAQSLHGKACMGVAAAAAEFGVPTVAIVGSTGPGAEDCTNPDKGGRLLSFISLEQRFGARDALARPAAMIEQAAFEIAQSWPTPSHT